MNAGSTLGGPTFSGTVELITDSYSADVLNSLASYNNTLTTGPGGSVWIHPRTPGKPITLGGFISGEALGLTDVQLDIITTPLLKIGDATSGTLEVISVITLTTAGSAIVPPASIQTLGGNLQIIAGLIVPPPPNIPTVTFNAQHQPLIRFATVPGQTYFIRSSRTLAPGSFTIVDTITATDIYFVWRDGSPVTVEAKFYTIESP